MARWIQTQLRRPSSIITTPPSILTVPSTWPASSIDIPTVDMAGLKKSLVYYIGNAGKGTKTEWMMHEYRFPPSNQEAEVWTLCRIFKKETSFNKFTPDTKTTIRNENLQEKRSGNFNNTPEVIYIVGSPIASPRSDLWTASNDNGFFGNDNGNWAERGGGRLSAGVNFQCV